MMTLKKILIADDHVLIREGLKHGLMTLYQNLAVIEASNGDEVLQQLPDNRDVKIMLLDLYMPGTDGYDLITTLSDLYPDIPVIVLSAADEQAVMRKVLDCGASGFIPKSTSHDVIFSAINLVMSGGVYIPPSMLDPAGNTTDNPMLHSPVSNINTYRNDRSDADAKSDALNSLTGRQREVYGLMIQGLQNKEIARSLGVSENTVKIHVTAILKALNVKNRTQAVVAMQNTN